MVVPENLSFGLKSCDSNYIHLYHYGYDIRCLEVNAPNIPDGGHVIEIWTHPFVFHGMIYTDINYCLILGMVGKFREQKIPLLFLEDDEFPEKYKGDMEKVCRRVAQHFWLMKKKKEEREAKKAV